MALLVLDDPLFDVHRSQAPHPECPERLAACRRGLRTAALTSSVKARLATEEELSLVHERSYVAELMAAAGQRGLFDADTYYSERSVEAARAAAGGVLELTETLLAQGRGTGLALVRPPGHHARPGGAMGFCLVNHVALAAARALALGHQRVAVVDWDVHHGNGTEEAFYSDPRVLYISTHQHPLYPGTGAATDQGAGEGRGFTVNVPLSAGAQGPVYAEVFQRIVAPVLAEYRPDLLLVSAGYDAHGRDPLGNMGLVDENYGEMMRWLRAAVGQAPTAVVLEGGYDLIALEGSIAATARALEEAPAPAESSRPDAGTGLGGLPRRLEGRHVDEIERVRRLQANFWGCL